jgi:hypothetical protein
VKSAGSGDAEDAGTGVDGALAAAGAAATAVTTNRRGTSVAGWSSAVTSRASRAERWKYRGRTSPRFSAVTTFESSTAVV